MKSIKGAMEEIQRLSKIVCDCQENLRPAEQALGNFVHEYMTENNMWENQEEIIKIISLLPQGYLRFTLYEQYYKLQEKQTETQVLQQ